MEREPTILAQEMEMRGANGEVREAEIQDHELINIRQQMLERREAGRMLIDILPTRFDAQQVDWIEHQVYGSRKGCLSWKYGKQRRILCVRSSRKGS